MSVQIKFRAAPESQKWESIQNGDYAILEGIVPDGLYRIFVIPQPDNDRTICIIPLFDGPFTDGQFPFFLEGKDNFPKLKHRISKVNIDVEVVE